MRAGWVTWEAKKSSQVGGGPPGLAQRPPRPPNVLNVLLVLIGGSTPGAEELFPRVGFIVTNLETPSRAVVRFYNKRGTAEQWIKEGKQRRR
jgi:hypothetical protein